MVEIKQPKIRFKGHINDWEQRKLGKVLDIHSGRDYKHLNIGNIPVYGTGGYMLSVDKALSYEEDAIGIGRKGTIDRPYILKAPFWTVDTLFYAIPRVSYDIEFIYSIFQKINWKAKDESTGVPSLSKTVINSISVNLPSSNEQQKIGAFFKQLDDTIALHQQKLEVTKQFKQTMLKKMFPKNGETTPEIRFKGFTDDWEECKLGNLCDILSGYNWKSKDYTDDGKFKIITIANVTGDYFINIDIGNNIDISNVDNKYVLKENDILITMTGNVGRASKVPSGNYLLNQRVCKISPKSIDNEFLYTILSDIQFENYCVLQGQGLAQANISNKDILNYKISIPNIKEQIIISDFFKNIDLNILHLENKINQCKEIKKTMLKKLFI